MAKRYMDTVSGSDSNTGLSGSPWKTMARLVATTGYADLLTAGDVVEFANGDYPLTANTTIPVQCTLYAASGATPSFSGAYYLAYHNTGTTAFIYGFIFNNTGDATNGRFVSNGSNTKVDIQFSTFENVSGGYSSNVAVGCGQSYISIKNSVFNKFSNEVFKGISGSGGGASLDIDGCLFYGCSKSSNGVFTSTGFATNRFLIESSFFDSCGPVFYNSASTFMSGLDFLIFKWNTVYNCDDFIKHNSTLSSTFSNCKIEKNYFHTTSGKMINNVGAGTLTIDSVLNRNNIRLNTVSNLSNWVNEQNGTTTTNPQFYDAPGHDFRIEIDSPLASYLGDTVGAKVPEFDAFWSSIPESKVENGYAYRDRSRTNNKTGSAVAGETDGNKVLTTSTIITGLYVPALASKYQLGENFGVGETGTLESTDPGQANVRSGTNYKINSVSKTGTLDLPVIVDVKNLVVYDNGTKIGSYDPITGNWEAVSASDLRSGVSKKQNGVLVNGLLDLPSVGNVDEGVIFDNGTKTGTLKSTDPGESNVKIGVAYFIKSVSKTGTNESTDPGVANVVSGTNYKIDSVSKVGTRTSIYPLLPADKVESGYDRGDGSFGTNKGENFNSILVASQIKIDEVINNLGVSITGSYVASERYSDPGEDNVKNGIAYKYNSTTNNRLGNILLPLETDVRELVDFGSNGELQGVLDLPLTSKVESGITFDNGTKTGTNKGEAFNSILTADKIKIDETITNLGNVIIGTADCSERYTDVPETKVESGYNYKYNSLTNNRTGTATSGDISLFTDVPEIYVKDGYRYKFNSSVENREGSLGRVVITDGDIISQLNNSIKTQAQSVLGVDFKELNYMVDITKNSFKNNYNRFGVMAMNSNEVNSVFGFVTMSQKFDIVLTTGFINKPMTDEVQRLNTLDLQNKVTQIYKLLVKTKCGLISTCINVSELSFNDPEYLEKDNVIVIRANINVLYRQKL